VTDQPILDKPHIQSLQTQFSSVTVSTELVSSTFIAFRSFEETAEFIKSAM
jgi:hypothetical protein